MGNGQPLKGVGCNFDVESFAAKAAPTVLATCVGGPLGPIKNGSDPLGQHFDSFEQYFADNAVSVKPDCSAETGGKYGRVNQRQIFLVVSIVSLNDGRECGHNRQSGHGLVHRAADDQACGYRHGSRQEVSIAVLATTRPTEFAAIQLVRACYSKVTPAGAQYASNQFSTGKDADGAKEGNKKTRDSQQHGDNRSGIHNRVTGRSGTTVLGKFVD